jgi:hypothetical protein
MTLSCHVWNPGVRNLLINIPGFEIRPTDIASLENARCEFYEL